MHDRFEKEVQQKMDELKLTPSAPVWEKVEMEINVDRRKRRGIFWLLFAGLFLGGAWWTYSSLNEGDKHLSGRTTKMETPRQHKKIPGTINQNTVAFTDSSLTSSPSNTTVAKTSEPGSNNIDKQIESKQRGDISIIARHTVNQKIRKSRTTSKNRSSDDYMALTKPITVPEDQQQKEKTPPADTKSLHQISTVVPSIITEAATKQPVDSAEKPQMTKEPVPELTMNDSSLKKKIVSEKKWKRQFNLTAGWSSYTSGLLTTSNVSMDAFSQSAGGVAPGGLTNFIIPETKGGFGFSAGFSAVRELSSHWEVSIGLQYSLFTSSIRVGEKQRFDTAVRFNMEKMNVDEFYTNTGANKYTNRFHMLELPVVVSFRPSVQLPLYFSVGASYGRLIAANALTYSRTSNIFYENNRNDFHDHFPIHASVQYRFGNKNGFSLQAGPVIQYNLSRLQKETVDGRSNLFFTGLRTSVSF